MPRIPGSLSSIGTIGTGWSTGWAASWLSGSPVHFYALNGSDLQDFLGAAVGDAHLLVRLCEMAEGIDQYTIRPPTVVNMSFGRLFAGDAGNGGCDPEELSCQVGQVIDDLVESGAVAVAAAGNHGRAQFPAAYESVRSAASLDMALFGSSFEIAGAWESPARRHASLPGYGVCLEYQDSDGFDHLWPAPPGSSYASALLAGWLSDILVTLNADEPPDVDWTISWSGTTSASSCRPLCRSAATLRSTPCCGGSSTGDRPAGAAPSRSPT